MAPRLSDVWLRLYKLAEAFDARGTNQEERVRAVREELLTMPPEVQQQSLERLETMSQVAAEVLAAWKAGRPQ